MILSTVRVEDFERFWNTFSTKGAEKRKQHGSKGSQVFRDPNDDNRVWVLFDWDEEGYKNLLSDPEMPAIFQEAGPEGRPQTSELARSKTSSSNLRCPLRCRKGASAVDAPSRLSGRQALAEFAASVAPLCPGLARSRCRPYGLRSRGRR